MGDETARTDVSNVRSQVRAPDAEVSPQGKADFAATQRPTSAAVDRDGNYLVADGDTLRSIAERCYGDAGGWERILAANRDQLADPGQLTPGQMLRIP